MKLYTVSLLEVPEPPQRERPEPVTVQAAGVFDAMLKAGPLFTEALQQRRLRPAAILRVTGFRHVDELEKADSC